MALTDNLIRSRYRLNCEETAYMKEAGYKWEDIVKREIKAGIHKEIDKKLEIKEVEDYGFDICRTFETEIFAFTASELADFAHYVRMKSWNEVAELIIKLNNR